MSPARRQRPARRHGLRRRGRVPHRAQRIVGVVRRPLRGEPPGRPQVPAGSAREACLPATSPAPRQLLQANFQYPDGVEGWWDENQFGCYQILGDLHAALQGHRATRSVITSPSGHAAGDLAGAIGRTSYTGIAPAADGSDDHSVHGSIDGNAQTKWCVDKAGKAVSWQVELPARKRSHPTR